MIKKVLLILSYFIVGGYIVYGQGHITGKVTGSDSPEGIPGVNVLIKGTTKGTITTIDGSYSIDVPGDTSVIVFSFVGYNNEEVIVGKQTVINVVLVPALEQLGEVIVTALGITRDEKALGYSIQKVDGDQVAKVKELDVINALSGKVSGVNIIQADGSLGGGGSRIVIRGESSLAGNNDPLYIINGIEGNANDVAPDDIESISVLKGAAAAALYGSKAGAGVVMITSKSGKNKQGTLVEFSSNTTFQTPLVLPKYQNKYGQGKGGAYNYINGTDGNDPNYDDAQINWGPKFDGQIRSQFTGKKPWVAYKNNVKDFYQVGHIFINSVAVSKSTEDFSSRFSYSNTDQKGILPNTGLATNRLALNSDFKINNKLKLSANLAYINTDCKNNASFDVRFIPRSIDIAALKNYWIPGMEGKQQMNWRRSDNNPYFWMYENIYSYKDTKFIFNVDLTYTILPNLTVVGRYGSNYTNNEYYDRRAPSTYNRDNHKDAEGWHKKGLANTKDRTAEFLISYDHDLFSDLNAKVSFGGTSFHKEYSKLEANGYGMQFFDLHDLNNSTYHIEVDDWFESLERRSLYGFINLAYQSKIYLDLTYRNDWSSTLHPDNNSYPYPSATLSAIMSDIFELPTVISFWKLRGSWAQVGKDIPNPYFIAERKYSWHYNDDEGLYYPEQENVKTDPKLKPEITTGIEFGTEVKLLNNRLGFDLTYYQSSTVNQLLKISASQASGYSYFMLNAGVISSKGVELSLYATPVKTNDLSWDMQLNWSFDRTYVDELIDSMPEQNKVQKVNSFLYIEDRVGQRRGTFYGQAYERAPNGERLYTLSGDTKLTAKQALGNYNPDWIASLSNNITYKNFSLSFLLDLRYGGLIYNEIERKLNMYGLSEATLLNDREGIVPDGMVEDNGTYRKLTMQDLIDSKIPNGQSGQQYWETQMEEACPENELIDDTYLKLREVSLSYNIPAKWLPGKTIKSATVAFVGRNLAVWSKVKHVDPETFGYASDNSDYGWSTKVPGYANSAFPSVRNFGFTLNCKF